MFVALPVKELKKVGLEGVKWELGLAYLGLGKWNFNTGTWDFITGTGIHKRKKQLKNGNGI